jgi:hypothetical protein
MAFEDYTVRQFEKALFKNDRSVMSNEEFEIVYTEWTDVTGAYNTNEFNKVVYINRLKHRLNQTRVGVKAQKDFINEFGIPYLPEISFFEKFGYKLKWEGDLESFNLQLDRIETGEFKYESQLEGKLKELEDLREKEKKKKESSFQQPKQTSRERWVKTINTLGKIGYQIRKDETTVEELAYMIKYQIEESKSK